MGYYTLDEALDKTYTVVPKSKGKSTGRINVPSVLVKKKIKLSLAR